MNALIAGLVIFLGMHFIHILAPSWRAAQVTRLGEKKWKGIFSLASLIGFGLLVWGYSQARLDPIMLWLPPSGLRYLSALLMLPAFILLVAAYVPGNRIKAMIGHPMTASVKLWAFAHLIVNGNLADVLLFGTFLVWAIAQPIPSPPEPSPMMRPKIHAYLVEKHRARAQFFSTNSGFAARS